MDKERDDLAPQVVPLKEEIFKNYLPYWPYFVLVGLISWMGAKVYLRYQVPQ